MLGTRDERRVSGSDVTTHTRHQRGGITRLHSNYKAKACPSKIRKVFEPAGVPGEYWVRRRNDADSGHVLVLTRGSYESQFG